MIAPIHIVTPNPALDVTYRVDNLQLGEANRVSDIVRISGGKGLNAANVLADLGIAASVGGFIGGALAQEFLAGIDHLDARFTLIEGSLRTTTTVVDDSGATAFNEAGPSVDESDWHALTSDTLATLREISAAAGTRAVFSLNGSIPPGSPVAAYTSLISRAREDGHLVFADTSGAYLVAAAEAGAHLLKPNHLELAAATGTEDITRGVAALQEAGAGVVIVSRGAEGLEVHAPGRRTVHAWLDTDVRGNTVGAGDAVVAAAIAAMAPRVAALPGAAPLTSCDVAETLLTDADVPHLVAAGAAAVAEPVAGRINPETLASFLPRVTTKEL
ncbi:1-phosphofructokinase family hexose kinase [Bowdeniella massiliensis]|uniref:1-phosphofructokinase family hexose kinase n=1 Tax=Bowdeniella massiliensis TaxID=2932264 RepID=UPI002027BBD5|nr:PfkB family carbohydrate kinase [Bowdeniella massiliensis]